MSISIIGLTAQFYGLNIAEIYNIGKEFFKMFLLLINICIFLFLIYSIFLKSRVLDNNIITIPFSNMEIVENNWKIYEKAKNFNGFEKTNNEFLNFSKFLQIENMYQKSHKAIIEIKENVTQKVSKNYKSVDVIILFANNKNFNHKK